jgi:hypothetical protein
VLGRAGVDREGAARRFVGGAVGEQDAPGDRRDQQQRRREQVEQRLIPGAARNRWMPLDPLDSVSLFRLPGEPLVPRYSASPIKPASPAHAGQAAT